MRGSAGRARLLLLCLAVLALVTASTAAGEECVNVSSGEPADCSAVGAVLQSVYDEHNDSADAPTSSTVPSTTTGPSVQGAGSGGGFPTGTVVAIVIVVLLIALLVGSLIWRTRRSKKDEAANSPTSEEKPSKSTVDNREGSSSGVTIRLSRAVLVGFVILLVAGVGVAAVLLLSTGEKCVSSDTGAEIDCKTIGAESQAEYDQQKADEAAAEAAQQAKLEKAQALAKQCEGQLNDLIDAEEELNSRLSVGVPFADYSQLVGSVRVAYDQVGFIHLKPDCLLQVGSPLEDALNSFAKAGSQWNDCIQDFDCAVDSIDPDLQKQWSAAEVKIELAKSALADLRKP